jgi:peptidoglycan/LPS O-acetylase OafA/YrhL
MDQERAEYDEPDRSPHVRGPFERAFRAGALVLVAAVLLAAWVVALTFVQMVSDTQSRQPPSSLWWLILIGVPLVVFLRFLYGYQPRVAVTGALLAAWMGGVWVAAVVSSGGFSAHRGAGLWFVPLFGVPGVVFVRFVYRCRRRTRAVPPRA